MVAGVLASYHSLIEDGTLQPDVAQGKAVKALADLSDQLVAQRVSKSRFGHFGDRHLSPSRGCTFGAALVEARRF